MFQEVAESGEEGNNDKEGDKEKEKENATEEMEKAGEAKEGTLKLAVAPNDITVPQSKLTVFMSKTEGCHSQVAKAEKQNAPDEVISLTDFIEQTRRTNSMPVQKKALTMTEIHNGSAEEGSKSNTRATNQSQICLRHKSLGSDRVCPPFASER